jgi:predicted transport protein
LRVSEGTRRFLLDVSEAGHYGTGDVKVDIQGITLQQDCIKIMNEIFEAMEKQLLD